MSWVCPRAIMMVKIWLVTHNFVKMALSVSHNTVEEFRLTRLYNVTSVQWGLQAFVYAQISQHFNRADWVIAAPWFFSHYRGISFYNVALFIEIWEYLFMLGSLRFCNSILINVSSGLWLGNCSTLCWYAFFGFSIHVTKHYNQAPQLWSPLVQKSCDLLKCNTARRACSW